MAFKRPNNPEGDVGGQWTSESAFNLPLALKESRSWIEAVTGERFSSQDFVESTKNGVLLCKLLNQISPGIVKKINTQKTAFAERENLQFFIDGCRELGLRNTQLFVSNDLYEGQRVRSVAITLYWLGRAARAIPSYKGPHLNLTSFAKMHCSRCRKPIEGGPYVVTLDQQWHMNCAKCDGCGKQLSDKEGYFPDGPKIFCPTCHGKCHPHDGHGHGHGHGARAPPPAASQPKAPASGPSLGTCPCCQKGVTAGQPAVDAGTPSRKFHKPCFNCCGCKKPLNPSGVGKPAKVPPNNRPNPDAVVISPSKGKPFCGPCAAENTCAACGDELSGPSVQAGPDKFHQPCFVCTACHIPFPKGEYFLVDGKPFCKNCQDQPTFTNLNFEPYDPSKCGTCKKPVAGKNTVTVQGKNYCPMCYCCGCSKLFREDEWYYPDEKNQKAWCPTCYDDRQSAPSGGSGAGDNCHNCGKPLAGKEVLETGNPKVPYCPECYCGKCHKVLNDDQHFIPDGQKAFCPGCSSGRPASKAAGPNPTTGGPCANCSKPTVNKECCKKNRGQPYCPDCYCQGCNRGPLRGNEATPTPDGKGKHCPQCAKSGPSPSAGAGSGCPTCGQPLNKAPPGGAPGQPVNCHGTQFHKPCFKCNGCHKPLNPNDNVALAPITRHPYCQPCAHNNLCPVCGEEMGAPCGAGHPKANIPLVQAGPQKYHQPCLVCSSCHKPFPDGKFVNVNGQPYCTGCKNNAPKTGGAGPAGAGRGNESPLGNCAKCHKPVSPSDGLEALDQIFHPKCFTCASCNRPFPDGNFVEVNNKPYCPPCSQSAGGGGSPAPYQEGVTPCAGCSKPLSGQVTDVYGYYWHFGCFKCQKCQKSLEKGFYQHQNRPYCLDCYHTVAGSECCVKCNQPLVGPCSRLKDKIYHESCLKCATCGLLLSQSTSGVNVKFSVPYCGNCFSKVKGATPQNEPAPQIVSVHYGDKKQGFTIDPRSGKKTIR